MSTTSFIKVRDTSVAVVVAALCVAGFYASIRLSEESRENVSLREQNRILGTRLKLLDQSFVRIRSHTKSLNALASGDVPEILADAGQMRKVSLDFTNKVTTVAEQKSDAEGFVAMLDLISNMNSDAERMSRRLENLASVLKSRKDLLNDIPSMMPTEGRIASEFGMRLSPFEGKRHMHAGVDIAAVIGEKVRAPADGEVTFAGNFETLGNSIVINHANGILTRYGHTSKLLVRKGQKVRRGQVIALVGNTGHSTGPHLHYEVWLHNEPVNPTDFFYDMFLKPGSEDLFVSKEPAKTLKPESAEALAAMGGEY